MPSRPIPLRVYNPLSPPIAGSRSSQSKSQWLHWNLTLFKWCVPFQARYSNANDQNNWPCFYKDVVAMHGYGMCYGLRTCICTSQLSIVSSCGDMCMRVLNNVKYNTNIVNVHDLTHL